MSRARQMILDGLEQTSQGRFSGSDANYNLVAHELREGVSALPDSRGLHTGSWPFTPEAVRGVIVLLAKRGALIETDREALELICDQHGFEKCTANFEALRAACFEDFGPVTAERLEDVLKSNDTGNAASFGIKSKLIRTQASIVAAAEAREHSALVAELFELAKQSRHKDSSGATLVRWRGRMLALGTFEAEITATPIEVLRALKSEREEIATLRNVSKEEGRAILRANDTRPIRQAATSSPYIPLPPTFRVPGKDIEIPWSPALIKKLPAQIVRGLVARHGAETIDSILNGTYQAASAAGA